MKIAFAATYDLSDIRRGSGTFYNLAQAIEAKGHVVVRLVSGSLPVPQISRLVKAIHYRVRRRHPLFLDPFVGMETGRKLGKQLATIDYDVLLTNDMAIAAYTPTSRPIVLYTDVMLTHAYSEGNLPYSRLNNMSLVSLYLARRVLKKAVERANLCIFPAHWQLTEVDRYGWKARSRAIVPFGANIEDPGESLLNMRLCRTRSVTDEIRILFVGKDWLHKGGELALQTVIELRRRGFDVVLIAVGERPASQVPQRPVRWIGYLDKSKAEDRQLLAKCYSEADFMILGSKREGLVIAALEACAFSLPVIAYDAIGITDAVIDRVSGRLLSEKHGFCDFADCIEGLISDEDTYRRLCAGARRHYTKEANWATSTERILGLVADIIRPSNNQSYQR